MRGGNKKQKRRGGERDDFKCYGTQTFLMNRQQLTLHYKRLTKRLQQIENKEKLKN